MKTPRIPVALFTRTPPPPATVLERIALALFDSKEARNARRAIHAGRGTRVQEIKNFRKLV